ncbi:hypothetical protein HNR42_003044 [Deinobacterium chartae]|uniref:Cupin domain-containing protein n=1 Tax=Deinobacterium chartae TaxID=521158 RepID=A0A841I1B1_9DEIO|nr:hypothetical protein [Deinobacterium chartae]MBB6099591.1 hypothetical protein [Deinobacterium chartae]
MSERPTVWHLPRLAASLGGEPLALPGAPGKLLTWELRAPRMDLAQRSVYLCLEGELLLDLPHGDFVHLRPLEACRIEAQVARTLTPVERASVLVIRES